MVLRVSPLPIAASIMMAEIYWLDSLPLTSMSPLWKVPLPLMVTGGQPVSDVASTPILRSVSSSGAMGRFCMCSSPVTMVVPFTNATAAVRKRVAVPALPKNSGSVAG